MNFASFISKRISKADSGTFTSTIHKIALLSVAIGLAIMVISILVLGGFKETVKQKIFDFSSHLSITKYTIGSTFFEQPLDMQAEVYQNYKQHDFIEHIQVFSYKASLLKTDEEIMGVVLKGVGDDFRKEEMEGYLVEGRFFHLPDSGYSQEVIVSKKIANLMKLTLDQEVLLYFVQNPPRFRKVTVVGIYETGLEEFDEKIIMGDIGLIQRLNDWSPNLVGGFEVFVKDPSNLEKAELQLFELTDHDMLIETAEEKHMQIFDWLGLLNQNVIIFLSLILFVACFNMNSILFILIMERTHMIGLLSAMGTNAATLRKIFIYSGLRLTLLGMLLGNAIGLGFGFIQQKFRLIPLDQENYYMSYVPIHWDWSLILLLNLLTFLLVFLVLLIPTQIISRISPVKAIKFD